MPALTIHHYNTAVYDLDEAVKDYTARFGMQPIGGRQHNPIGRFDFQSMGYDGNLICRLITPATEDAPLARLSRLHHTTARTHMDDMKPRTGFSGDVGRARDGFQLGRDRT